MNDIIEKIETEAKTIELKVDVTAKQIWEWFENEIGITHQTTKAAQALHAIVPKPVLIEPIPQVSSPTSIESSTTDSVISGTGA